MPGEKEAALISYDAHGKRFKSSYERNKFYRGLYGYRQKVRRNDKVYRYDKDGMLDEVPHIKVEDSVFIVHRRHLHKFKSYFRKWGGKVEVEFYRIKVEGDHADEIVEEKDV